jgi:hypothetical protein
MGPPVSGGIGSLGDLASSVRRRRGSGMPRFVGLDGVPANVGWSRMNDDERQIVRELQAAHLPAGGEPPFPLIGYGVLLERFMRMQTQPEGELAITIGLGRFGNVRSVTMVGAGADDANIQREIEAIVENSSFSAARCNGQPCAGQVTLTVWFPT